jgi:hypothetical protein
MVYAINVSRAEGSLQTKVGCVDKTTSSLAWIINAWTSKSAPGAEGGGRGEQESFVSYAGSWAMFTTHLPGSAVATRPCEMTARCYQTLSRARGYRGGSRMLMPSVWSLGISWGGRRTAVLKERLVGETGGAGARRVLGDWRNVQPGGGRWMLGFKS